MEMRAAGVGKSNGKMDIYIERFESGTVTKTKEFVTDNPSMLSLYIHTKEQFLRNLEWSDVVHIEIVHNTK
jgi:hypothetical protein